MKKWYEDLKISKKITYGTLIMAIIAAIVGIAGIVSINKINHSGTLLYKENTLGLEYLGSAYSDFNNLRYASLKLTTEGSGAEKAAHISEITELCASIDDLLTKYEGTQLTSEITGQYKDMETEWKKYKRDIEQVIQTGSICSDTFKLDSSLEKDFTYLMDIESHEAGASCDSNIALAKKAAIIMIAIIVIGVITSLLLGYYTSRTISEPIQKYAAFGEMLAVGDIHVEKVIEEKDRRLKYRKDEIGTLAASFDKMIEGTIMLSKQTETIAGGDLTAEVTIRSEKDVLGKALQKLVTEFNELISSIIASSEQITAGAAQVSAGAQSLAQGATEQASSVQELSASISEVSQHVKQNAEDAQKAAVLSARATEIMQNSESDMELAEKAMKEISVTSKDIGKVIKAIDDIAFQTNILALNAAVEAARAGAAGKGFAVVADEVRNLSQKSAEAAKNTTALIESSIAAVEKGTELVNKTGASFTEVAAKASEISKLVEAISAQSQEQATAIFQISIGTEQVSSVIQMNSATSEESAASSEELSSQANSLKKSVNNFKVRAVE